MLGACLLLFAWAAAHASAPDFAPRVTESDTSLVRLGQGTARYAGFIPVYDAALYTEQDVAAADILEPAVAKRLEIVYRVSLSASDMITAAQRTLGRQHDQHQLARWSGELDTLHAAYRDVKRGDRYALVFRPRDGLSLEFNGRKIITVNDAGFAQLYFGIWLGESPLSAELRNALLDEHEQE